MITEVAKSMGLITYSIQVLASCCLMMKYDITADVKHKLMETSKNAYNGNAGCSDSSLRNQLPPQVEKIKPIGSLTRDMVDLPSRFSSSWWLSTSVIMPTLWQPLFSTSFINMLGMSEWLFNQDAPRHPRL